MKFIIDRFEGDKAIIEDENKNIYEISKSALAGFCEGDVIIISKDEDETNERKNRIDNLANELFNWNFWENSIKISQKFFYNILKIYVRYYTKER